jgi:hypothetical protein
LKILVIPDAQVKPGHPVDYLRRIGEFIVDKKPDVIVNIGDFADMPSLSSYDRGTKAFEGRRYKADVEAVHAGMDALLGPLNDYNRKAAKGHRERYNPRRILTLGNHEYRIVRATNEDPKLDGTIGLEDLKYQAYGWEVYDFLDVVVVGGIAFSHYFVTGVAGRPAGTAAAQLRKTNMSSVAGHQQGKQIAYGTKADGTTITSIIAGSCYEHDEDYLGAQGNKHWRGVIMLHDVKDGMFDEMFVNLEYLKRKYG